MKEKTLKLQGFFVLKNRY